MTRTLASAIVLALTTAFLALLSPSPAWALDHDCPDFATQRAAQIYYLHHGGPQQDPDRLDADNDGIACDSNPCPCYYGSHVPTSAPAVHRRPLVHTRARLGLSRHRAIAGEPVRMTVRVLPHRTRHVRVQRYRDGHWRTTARGRTSSAGVFRVTRAAASPTTRYRALVTKARTSTRRYTSATSNRVRLTNQRQLVTLTAPSRTVEWGDDAQAVAVASPVRVGRTIALQRRADGAWHTFATGPESRTGRVSYDWVPSTVGSRDYRAVVLARNGARRVATAPLTIEVVDTTPPDAPNGLVATPGDQQVTLSWTAPPGEAVHEYHVFAGANPMPYVVSGDSTGTTVTGLTNGTEYEFTVSAVDLAGNESGASSPATATPNAPVDGTQ